MTEFNQEADFEAALIAVLSNKGWESQVIKNPTEADLLQNWADILFNNNSGIDRLNDVPLSSSEMQQIIEQIHELKTPLKLNGFINGKTVNITRDNPADKQHLGKEISLEIYDRQAIAAGRSRYQIVQQPRFNKNAAKKSKLMRDRRGDVMLLINGLPVIHIELKRSGIPVSHATNQIEKYTDEGVFTGLFALVQVFVAMSPSDTLYFANAGQEGRFNKDYFFHWADFNNEPVNDWKDIASTLLSIPMAHQLIGFYTVADGSDGVLKVMRSYQYYAANAISDKVAKTHWADSFNKHNQLGGYVWHTTGSGKTMTSFKSAQLIAQSKDADKVVFLMDRIELGVQSLREYKGFAGDSQDVQATENTHVLITKLKSADPANTLIVSSIQKMSNINEDVGVLQSDDIELINAKRLVFIVDEAHRSTFGDMLITIKKTFPAAIFFGFTGTPIQTENQKKKNTTSSVFGDELHRYSIADGIRDKNVLGFDPYMVTTFRDKDLRRAVGLLKAKANSESEAFADPKKKAIFNRYMNDVSMAGYKDGLGNYIKGIEDEIPPSQYGETHKQQVVADILDNWVTLSQGNKFHAILATHSITDAIDYYRRIKQAQPELKITALFDPHINEGEDYQTTSKFKQDGLLEIIDDYNQRYEQAFDLASHGKFKKDLSARLAHKKPYLRITHSPEQQLDLLIVVDQMLTGFDSKWLNTLYLDKVLTYENIIQAFSRTNRLFGPDKPFGTIRYYRYPHSMERNIDEAVALYSGNKVMGLFADQLETNLQKMNETFAKIATLFSNAGVHNFEKLPDNSAERGQFAKLFRCFNESLEAAKIQGFMWEDNTLALDENTYLVLALRYKELASSGDGSGSGGNDVPFDIDGHLTEIDTGKIDTDYMNSRFDKYLKSLSSGANAVEIQNTVDALHQSFASLTQEEQKFADIFLRDVQRGDITPQADKTFRDYITEYQRNAQNSQVSALVDLLAADATEFRDKLNAMINSPVTNANINEFGRFDAL
ncbi:MAG: HsdR family type I site-specific deoxyribonuclease, partial [Mariprofundaceae bacterium]|nr:HsdR family type I site-specific deoxyribonuclease [Mariprofundaceae bacterium]